MPRTFLSLFRIAQQRNVLLLLIDVVEKEPDDPHTRREGGSVGSVPFHSAPAISVMASLDCRDDEG